MGAGDASKVYRAFKASKEHLVEVPTGGYRLSSAWFRCTRGGVSVDDGHSSSPEDTWERNQPCGVAAIAKEVLAARGLKLDLDPEDTSDDLKRNPSHRVVLSVSAKDAKRISAAAEIVLRLEGWQVRGANGSMGRLLEPPPLEETVVATSKVAATANEPDPNLLLFPLPEKK